MLVVIDFSLIRPTGPIHSLGCDDLMLVSRQEDWRLWVKECIAYIGTPLDVIWVFVA